MIGTESKFFYLQGLKPEIAHITGTKGGINPKIKVQTNFESVHICSDLEHI